MSGVRLRWRGHRRCARLRISTFAPLVGLAAAGFWALTPPAAGATTTPATNLVWSILSPSATPPPLEFASAVYDSDNHTIVLFGGLNSQGSLSDSTFVWNGSTWIDYSPAQIEEPPARYLASMAFDPALHQLLLFGGRNAAGRQLNDTWAWNGASWYNVNRGEAISPAPRDGASLAYDGQGHLLLFGGEGPAVAGESAPSASPQRSSASPLQNLSPETPTATAAPPTTLGVLGDTWEWGGNSWTPVATSGPPPRLNAAATYDAASGAVLMFGGTSTPTGSTSAPTPLGDTWTWTGTGWSQASLAGSPPARFGAVAADDPVAGGVVLFGGSSGAGPLGDTWLWNGSGWSQITATGAPGARLGAVGGFETASGQLVVFGGAGTNGGLLGNTLVLTAGAPVPLGPATTGPATTVGSTQKSSQSTRPGVPTASSASAGTPNVPQRSRALAIGGNGSGGSGGKRLPVLHRGQLVTLRGSGFSPDAQITITFHSTPVVVGKTSADARGDITATVAVPDRAPAGTHHFDASGLTPTGQSTKVLATVMVAVSGSSSRPSLATTGALLGVALVVPLGTWLLLGARSRVRHRVA